MTKSHRLRILVIPALVFMVALNVRAAEIKHKFVATDESGQQLIYVDETNPENDWTVPLPGNRDIQLSNKGTVLVSVPVGYREYSLRSGELIKEVKAGEGICSLHRLDNGHTFLSSSNGVIELDKNDKQVNAYPMEMGRYLRLLRLSKSGNFLYTSSKIAVKELKPDAEAVRELDLTKLTPECTKPYLLEELGNGQFLVSTGFGGTVLILDKDWKLLKSYGGKGKVDGIDVHFFADAQRLKNGNVVVAHWTGHDRKDSEKAPQAIEFDKNGKVVWTWHNPKRAGTLHGIEIIEEDIKLAGFDKIVFVKRDTYQTNHYYTDYINGCKYFGGNISVLSLKDGSVRDIVPSMKHGIFGRFDLSFDGKKVVFDWKEKIGVGFRIYEVNVDGTGLRQLTFPPADEAARIKKYKLTEYYQHHTDDMHPCYLPDGGICFISSRCEFGILCDAPDLFTTTVLYRMDADGKNIQKLSNSSVSEASPSVMNDGRILYTRWEYVDKGAVSVKCLWAMRPDGTGSAEVYGNDISLPPTILHGKAIPGHNNLFVAMGTPHYPQGGVGTVILIDTNKDIRTIEPMTYITPHIEIRAEGGFHHKRDGRWIRNDNGPLFADAYPLSKELFLVSHNHDKHWNDPKAWGLYLLDGNGKTTPIYYDPDTSCWQPVPLKSRPVPPVSMSVIDEKMAKKNLATVIVTDVYHGMEGIERGSVKYIRINEQIPRPWGARRFWEGDDYDQQHACITKDTHLGLKVQHGIVPVYEDGSAHFVVPADRNIFFQALDENYMELQRERTYVNYRPGELRSCIGCHETPRDAPMGRMKIAEALKKTPSVPGPQPGEKTGKRTLDYARDVQPVLDKHCVECHSGNKQEAGLDLSGQMTELFNKSYESLIPERREGTGRKSFDLIGPTIGENHPKIGNVHYLPAKSIGSHASVLVSMLSKGKVTLKDQKLRAIAKELAAKHKDIELSTEEMVRLTTWVDSNGQYYGTYYGRKNLKYKEHPNFRPDSTVEQAQSLVPPIKEEDR